jgi:hypothetical protein
MPKHRAIRRRDNPAAMLPSQRSSAERPCSDPVPAGRSSGDAALTIRLRKMLSNA